MHFRRHSALYSFLPALLGLVLLPLTLAAKPREVWERYKIAVISADGEAPAAKAIEAGARAKSPALEDEYYLALKVDNLSPVDNTPRSRQAALNRAFLEGYHGVLLSVGEGVDVADEVDFLSRHGIPVVTVGANVDSTRLASIVTDEEAAGRLAAETFLKNMRYMRDNVALMAGTQGDPVAERRLAGAKAVLAEAEVLNVDGPYATDETFASTYPLLREVTEADYGQNLRGWLILGNWPLLGGQPLPWQPGKKVCVVMDATPHIIPFLASGQVQAALAEDNFAMGELGMQLLIEKVHNGKEPEQLVYAVPPAVITPKDLAKFQADWTRWLQ
ncbi:substrate-binding domain-containing protein [Ruficoccus sp. ZRK36]|uniref:sugar ABC transporter substrate-binding protein n=1 Tax=Ruficoccus sp. ZRK36 TaxID=2866311 RepID=UPI001C733292|nr:substrate-binding domain-containing protein [Ruficoccus sp. ZRK36]QYY36924.1 substrate-binding domain-containing protein [Ruficoccus sp. ZRK36]